jgi:hypothetical protein
MISTLYLILLIAFQLWYWTSSQVKYAYTSSYVLTVKKNPERYRIVGGVLLVIAAALFVIRMGWMSGLSAWLVGLMGVGSLVVMLAPHHYLRPRTVIGLYILFLILELFI